MKLIYDVGVENGDDSAYYLTRADKVVGVEANPVAAANLRRRFAPEIAAGRYVLLSVGIAETSGVAPFWVCDDHPQWSSFDREIARRAGSRHHRVDVETRPFGSILDEFGSADFCKIDIEGNDNLCIGDFTPGTRPRYVSVELILGQEELQLRLLAQKGYSAFKIISQRSFRQPTRALLALNARLPAPLRRAVTGATAYLARYRSRREWRFRPGSSGPFGEDTPGPWRPLAEALETCKAIGRLGDPPYDWHDIHARLDPA